MADGFTLDKVYDPRAVEPDMYARWEASGAFRSAPTDPPTPHEKTFTIVIPPPNVTGALHLGHALNNTLQDILVRYHRMRGFNTLWQPGTDHAGIATQAVVERRIREQEGKSRHELGREELVRRIWQWKDEYEKRIIGQLKLVGCSCDWGFKKVGEETGRDGKKHDRFECDGHRTRFTLDDGLARAVRHMFFRLFRDGLIFRGKRLVNWDTQLQTAVADDEVYYETVKGAFYYFRYSVIPVEPGAAGASSEPRASARANAPEPEYVIIATTRPETMLGDVAVAVHPDPAGELDRRERELREQLAAESRASSRAELEAKLAAIAARRESHLPLLITLSRMAREGRKLRLPLVDRVIPLIADDWADPMLGTGCVKITPAHDPNDYNVGLKHNLAMINVLTPDGKIARIMEPDATAAPVKTGTTENAHSDRYAGLEFSEEGRRKVVADIEAAGLLEKIEDRDIEIGHSDRSKSPIEPYLSDQWFVRTGDVDPIEDTSSEPRASALTPRHPNEPRASVRAESPEQPNLGRDESRHRATPDLTCGGVLVTWTTYGTWLPGDRRGFVSRVPRADGLHDVHNTPGEAYDAEEAQLLASAADRMTGKAVWLDREHAESVLRSVAGACERNGIEPLAIAVMRNHVHVLCQCDRSGHELLQILKGNASRDLNKAFRLEDAPRWWTKGGSTRFVRKNADLSAAMSYVVEQESPLALWRYDVSEGATAQLFESARAEARGSLGLQFACGMRASGLAQAAIDVVEEGRIQVFPERYAKSYLDWLGEKRDWCISRQLWWGHRISVWTHQFTLSCDNWDEIVQFGGLDHLLKGTHGYHVGSEDFCVRVLRSPGPELVTDFSELLSCPRPGSESGYVVHICYVGDDPEVDRGLTDAHFEKDPDVLDTWFSSALWPFSTLGWPEETPHLKNYYPGSVLVTSRDIITNWVARMVMFGLYALGDVPFDHVYIHPKILDGRGETMSKSKGNGVDPIDIIHTHGADALRYALADMCTETQDIRMPVEYVCPHCGGLVDQAVALKAEEQNRKSRGQKLDRRLQPSDCKAVRCTHDACKKEFATQWADEASKKQHAVARETSDKFDIGRNFCNKLWNAARFAFMNIEGARCDRLDVAKLPPEDRWFLARLSQTIRRFHDSLQQYQFAAAVKELRDFFWDSLCDWYIELTKPRLSGGDANDPARQVLAFCIDQVLRLWHPVIPFITERLWQQLGAITPQRGLPGVAMPACDSDLITAEFPPVEGYPGLEDESILAVFALLQDATRGVRDLRNQAGVPPKDKVTVTVVVPRDSIDSFRGQAHVVRHSANIGELHVSVDAKRPANAATMNVGGLRIYVHDISDDTADRTRTAKALDALSKQIDGKRSKLSNEKFVANAKPEVVEAERTRLAELEREERALREHLAELESSR